MSVIPYRVGVGYDPFHKNSAQRANGYGKNYAKQQLRPILPEMPTMSILRSSGRGPGRGAK